MCSSLYARARIRMPCNRSKKTILCVIYSLSLIKNKSNKKYNLYTINVNTLPPSLEKPNSGFKPGLSFFFWDGVLVTLVVSRLCLVPHQNWKFEEIGTM